MITSENIEKLAVALSKAQSAMTGAKKSEKNLFFKSKYSNLESVIEAISEPFAFNGLCFVQGAEFNEGRISVKTRIIHSSGQWIESDTVLPPTKNDAQGYGSAITYARRYGLQSLAGVPSVDDDGNAAVKHQAESVALDTEMLEKIRTIENSDELKALFKSLPEKVAQAYLKPFRDARSRIDYEKDVKLAKYLEEDKAKKAAKEKPTKGKPTANQPTQHP
jgi:hypothetical protein